MMRRRFTNDSMNGDFNVSAAPIWTARVALWCLMTIALLAPSSPAHAQASTGPFLFGLEGASYQDGAASLLFNPAATGLRYPSELAITWLDSRLGKNAWRGILTRDNLSLAASAETDGAPAYSVAFSRGPDHMRLGVASSWIPQPGQGRVNDTRIGLLSRPEPYLSWGVVADHVTEPTLSGMQLDREYTIGAGWRPLAHRRRTAHKLGTQFTLTADVRFLEKWGRGQYQPRFGAEIEPAPGISLRGIYVPKERSFQSALPITSGNRASMSPSQSSKSCFRAALWEAFRISKMLGFSHQPSCIQQDTS